jgi:hypothetical protein
MKYASSTAAESAQAMHHRPFRIEILNFPNGQWFSGCGSPGPLLGQDG